MRWSKETLTHKRIPRPHADDGGGRDATALGLGASNAWGQDSGDVPCSL